MLTRYEQRCAVVGSPVAHSLSPAIHRAAYAELGLPWSYEAFDVPAGGFAAFVAGLDADQWRGLSVTMPHKDDAATLGTADEVVRLCGAANTVVFDGDGIAVHNTDVTGFQIALDHHGVAAARRLLLVGNGATARSALVAGARMGVTETAIWCRQPERARPLADLAAGLGVAASVTGFDALTGAEAPGRFDVAISTVPAVGAEPVAARIAAAAPVVFDVIYDPWPTPLATAAERAGARVLNGLDLLAAQAVGQIEYFTGHSVPVAVTLRAVHAAIAQRHGGPDLGG